ncbi:MAG: NAD-dependent epimerase/dehydratase family protein [Deltaproteobacteria bacterium]|nr:NAD-dependent epimerase/dehydratase family protein [Deltaproteobacteria bacterium]
MKILVTGGCGFLGTNLCLHFARAGHEVAAYDNLAKLEFERNPLLPPEARFANLRLLEEAGVAVIQADVRDLAALSDAASGCGYICHTAAQAAMTISWEDPLLDFSVNAAGSVNALEAARRHNIPIALCSTIHTFGPDNIHASMREEGGRYVRTPPGITEDEPRLAGAVTPLRASKRAVEIYTRCYIDTYTAKAACFTLTGLYGPLQYGGEDHGWLANFAIRALLGKPITIFGNGRQTRDMLFVSDAVAAFEKFLQNPVPGLYNLGAGERAAISLNQAVALLSDVLGREVAVEYKPDRFGDLKYFVTDYSRFHKACGWSPEVLPAEGVPLLVEWAKEALSP